jgi:hypothetical protein
VLVQFLVIDGLHQSCQWEEKLVLMSVFVVTLRKKGVFGGVEHCALEERSCLELVALGRVDESSFAIRGGAGVDSPWRCDQMYCK